MEPQIFPQPGPAPGNQPSAITGRDPGDDRDAAQRAESGSTSTGQRWLMAGVLVVAGVLAGWWIVALVLAHR